MNCEHCHDRLQQRLDGANGVEAPEMERSGLFGMSYDRRPKQ